jgi:hypothetical protein
MGCMPLQDDFEMLEALESPALEIIEWQWLGQLIHQLIDEVQESNLGECGVREDRNQSMKGVGLCPFGKV